MLFSNFQLFVCSQDLLFIRPSISKSSNAQNYRNFSFLHQMLISSAEINLGFVILNYGMKWYSVNTDSWWNGLLIPSLQIIYVKLTTKMLQKLKILQYTLIFAKHLIIFLVTIFLPNFASKITFINSPHRFKLKPKTFVVSESSFAKSRCD